jgi:hypothetical protein
MEARRLHEKGGQRVDQTFEGARPRRHDRQNVCLETSHVVHVTVLPRATLTEGSQNSRGRLA